jgi:hypothetical protein
MELLMMSKNRERLSKFVPTVVVRNFIIFVDVIDLDLYPITIVNQCDSAKGCGFPPVHRILVFAT